MRRLFERLGKSLKSVGHSHLRLRRGRLLSSADAPDTEIKVITLDVTGTLISYKGSVGEWYCSAASRVGVACVGCGEIEKGFKQAYDETCLEYPCFGGKALLGKEWWRICVRRSFELAGHEIADPDKFERVFQRIYSLFGSPKIYDVCPDVIPFLIWAKRRGYVIGILSNSDERYADGVLPMFGIGDEVDFMIFSKLIGSEKPDPVMFEEALTRARRFLEAHGQPKLVDSKNVLHIGNSYNKDYLGATGIGFHSVLMDRYNDFDLETMKAKGVPIVKDFFDVVEHITKMEHSRIELQLRLQDQAR